MSWRILPAIRIPGTGIAAVFRRKMKIAQIAPLAESVPPRLYGGTGKGCFLSHRGAGAARPRRHALRERRLADLGPPCRPRAARCGWTERNRRVTASPAHDRARAKPGARVRRSSFPCRPGAPAALRPYARKSITTCTDASTWPTLRPCIANSTKCRSCRSPTRSENRCRSPTGSAPSITASPSRYAPSTRPARQLPRLPRTHVTGEGVERAIEIARRAGRRLRIAAAKIDRTEEDYIGAASPFFPTARRLHRRGRRSGKPGFLGNAAALLFRSTGRSRSGLR